MLRAVILFSAAATSACTLLVQFVDAPDAGEAGADVIIDSPPDVAPPYDASHVCTGLQNGYYCGFNGLNGTPPVNWLVVCEAGKPEIIRDCDAGCLAFPNGTPDECNECVGKPLGDYCGSQFPTYTVYNAAYLISCAQGVAAIQGQCTNGCQPGPGDASCK